MSATKLVTGREEAKAIFKATWHLQFLVQCIYIYTYKYLRLVKIKAKFSRFLINRRQCTPYSRSKSYFNSESNCQLTRLSMSEAEICGNLTAENPPNLTAKNRRKFCQIFRPTSQPKFPPKLHCNFRRQIPPKFG